MAAADTPRAIRLGELLQGYADVPAGLDRPIAGVALDSRQVVHGGLFLACRGATRHGLDFVDTAVARGAAAVAWEPVADVPPPKLPSRVAAIAVPGLARRVSAIAGRFYDEPSTALDVVGVTGTNGKSSTVLMLAEAMAQLSAPTGVIGTLGAGWPASLSTTGLTTPDPVAVQQLLARFRDEGAAAVAMEASSHGLDQARLEAVRFRAAVFTNLTRDHLDYHGSHEAYAEAKARLFTWAGLSAAVVNLDDPFGQILLDRLSPGVTGIGYTLDGRRPTAGSGRMLLSAQTVRASAEGIELEIDGDWGRASVTSPVIGTFNAANLLAVLGALLALGKPYDAAVRSLGGVHAAPGRMECFGGGDQPLVLVDFAHTPDALEKALAAAREHAAGRVLAVFGCGGDRDRGKRPLMAEVAARYADLMVVTDDNPRSEPAADIAADIVAGFPPEAAVRVEHDRRQAIAGALAEAQPGDVVVVAGKGHETVQIVGTEHRPFDDREVVRSLLRGC
ncbi:MAG TPA: UDP-N-acetylmuramoyl-L-alanyl-D-glutamate--2,6-diaminopimelate ligase [Gammaproteobacteria bacterium]|nr:UDP-N-acetylmuramoyl-L-alanyl-D-glutamate--2,6-diaminopimelate ligase [Gammaproteobacteria bacterium]